MIPLFPVLDRRILNILWILHNYSGKAIIRTKLDKLDNMFQIMNNH